MNEIQASDSIDTTEESQPGSRQHKKVSTFKMSFFFCCSRGGRMGGLGKRSKRVIL